MCWRNSLVPFNEAIYGNRVSIKRHALPFRERGCMAFIPSCSWRFCVLSELEFNAIYTLSISTWLVCFWLSAVGEALIIVSVIVFLWLQFYQLSDRTIENRNTNMQRNYTPGMNAKWEEEEEEKKPLYYCLKSLPVTSSTIIKVSLRRHKVQSIKEQMSTSEWLMWREEISGGWTDCSGGWTRVVTVSFTLVHCASWFESLHLVKKWSCLPTLSLLLGTGLEWNT